MTASLEIRNLCRRYGRDVHALQDASLAVAAGEFVTLLGPSGSGKSTILKIVAGVEPPTSGDVIIDGRSVVDLPPHRRGIGMVFQNYALFPHMTVWENVAFPLHARNSSTAETQSRVERVLAATRLTGFGQRFPRELSGGQQQRVALARAVVFDPQLLLMDEPLGALDRHLREQLKAEIKRIQQELHMTVLFVTHDQDEALVMSDRVVVMRDGRIEQVAKPRDLYARPANRFVASFVGEANLLRCTVSRGIVRYGDKVLPCKAPGEADGERWLMVRPELVELAEEGGADALSGTVRSVAFLGEAVRYTLDLGGLLFQVKAASAKGRQSQVDDRCGLTWAPADAVLLAD
jgi:putative spermidine/putrescine transport system ATP-binding protein